MARPDNPFDALNRIRLYDHPIPGGADRFIIAPYTPHTGFAWCSTCDDYSTTVLPVADLATSVLDHARTGHVITVVR